MLAIRATAIQSKATEFVEVLYTEPVWIPEIELNIIPGALELNYAYMFLPNDGGAMHMAGIGFVVKYFNTEPQIRAVHKYFLMQN